MEIGMGTSTDYAAPPSWGSLKAEVTRAGGHLLTAVKAGELLRDHVGYNGGSQRIASSGGVLGAGRTSQQVARNIAGFFSQVGSIGLAEALRENGLEDLVGRPAQEVLLGIVSLCGGTNGSIDAADARSALSRLMDELCEDAVTADDVEKILSAQSDGAAMSELLMGFFAYYLYEQFCRVFFRQLVQKHGEQRAESFLNDILDFIQSALENHTLGVNVSQVDWFGSQGNQMATTIMQQTLEVFER
jgi:hypothetical protein